MIIHNSKSIPFPIVGSCNRLHPYMASKRRVQQIFYRCCHANARVPRFHRMKVTNSQYIYIFSFSFFKSMDKVINREFTQQRTVILCITQFNSSCDVNGMELLSTMLILSTPGPSDSNSSHVFLIFVNNFNSKPSADLV